MMMMMCRPVNPFTNGLDGPGNLLEAALGGVKCGVGEIKRASVMAVEDELADGEAVVVSGKSFVGAGEYLFQGDEVIEAFAHFFPVNSNHIIVQPVAGKGNFIGGFGLCYFAFVVGKLIFEAAAVDIEGFAEVFGAHYRAFEVPAGVAHRPGAGPTHNVVRFGLFPEGEVGGILFFGGDFDTCTGLEVVEVFPGEFSVVGKFGDVEIDRAVDLVCEAFFEEGFDQFDLFDDMSAGAGADVGSQAVEAVHIFEVTAGVEFGQGHRMFFFFFCSQIQFVFALVGVVSKMADVGDVLDVSNRIAEVSQVSDEDVETDVAFGVSEVSVAIDGGSADVDTDGAFVERFELFFSSGQAVVQF